jgi:GMP synthase (glutamine-hydrolysing)
MKIQVLQNISFEGPGYIEQIAEEAGHELIIVHLYDGEQPLPATDFDMMVILGGPMNVYEECEYPWLTTEKKAIDEAIHSNKIVLGICLGAQLIADVLGAEVYKNENLEIGWYPVTRTLTKDEIPPVGFFPEKAVVFHWHNDTFDIPRNAKRIYRSDATTNQAFIYEEKVFAIQFHLEMSEKSIEDFFYFFDDEPGPDKFVMQKEEMLKLIRKYDPSCKAVLRDLFNYFNSLQ